MLRKPAVDGFTLLSRLGRGQFTEVYRARDDNSHKIFILNLYMRDDTDKDASKEAIEDLKREVATLKAVSSPHILRYEILLRCAKYYCLVFEDCPGGNLMTYIQKNDISQPIARLFLLQICSGIRVLHRARFVHRCLNPKCLLLIETGKSSEPPILRISNFKKALCVTTCGGRSGLISGTAPPFTPITAYTAPEIRDEKPHSYPADVYSIGAIFYECIFGSPPPVPTKFTSPRQKSIFPGKKNENVTDVTEFLPLKKFSRDKTEAGNFALDLLQADGNKRPKIDTILNLPFTRDISCKDLVSRAYNTEETDDGILIFHEEGKAASKCSSESGSCDWVHVDVDDEGSFSQGLSEATVVSPPSVEPPCADSLQDLGDFPEISVNKRVGKGGRKSGKGGGYAWKKNSGKFNSDKSSSPGMFKAMHLAMTESVPFTETFSQKFSEVGLLDMKSGAAKGESGGTKNMNTTGNAGQGNAVQGNRTGGRRKGKRKLFDVRQSTLSDLRQHVRAPTLPDIHSRFLSLLVEDTSSSSPPNPPNPLDAVDSDETQNWERVPTKEMDAIQ